MFASGIGADAVGAAVPGEATEHPGMASSGRTVRISACAYAVAAALPNTTVCPIGTVIPVEKSDVRFSEFTERRRS